MNEKKLKTENLSIFGPKCQKNSIFGIFWSKLKDYNNTDRADHTLKKKKLSLIILGLFLAICVLNSIGFFYHIETQTVFDQTTNNTIIVSSTCSPWTPLIGIIRDSVVAVSRVILPLILLVITNILLVRKLLKVKNVLTTSISLRREYKFALTITILNFIYAFSNLVSLVSLVLINVYGYNQTYVSTTSDESAIASFVYICANLFATFTNCDLLFFVNLLSNKKFRKEAQKIFFKTN